MKISFKKPPRSTWTQGKELTPNGVFDKVVLVNLDRRPDRLAYATQQCEMVGIKFERLAGIDGKDQMWRDTISSSQTTIDYGGYIGDLFAVSALNATMRLTLRKAIAEGWESFLWMEDDVCFHKDFAHIFSKNIRYIPDDWKMIHGGNKDPIFTPTWLRGDIYKTNSVIFCTHFAAFNHTIFKQYLSVLEECKCEAIECSNVMKKSGLNHGVYVFVPLIAGQNGDFGSDINLNHSEFVKSQWS